MSELPINLIVVVLLTVLGYFFGRYNERRHFESIRAREAQMQNILIFNERHLPVGKWQDGMLVGGNVVISVDYFKRLVAGLRGIVGGRLTTYETLLERARREALLRMKDEADHFGSEMIINVRIETASISKGQGSQIGSVEVYAYGTALVS